MIIVNIFIKFIGTHAFLIIKNFFILYGIQENLWRLYVVLYSMLILISSVNKSEIIYWLVSLRNLVYHILSKILNFKAQLQAFLSSL